MLRLRRAHRRPRRRLVRRLVMLGVAAGATAYRRRRVATNERELWPDGPPGRPAA